MTRTQKPYFCFSFSAICVFSFDSKEDEMAFPVDVRTLVARGCCLVRFSELAFDRFLSITNWSRILPAGSGSLF